MVEYCKHCGKLRTGEVCRYCGHNYEPKKIDEVKHEVKRHLRKTRMRMPPLLSLVIFAIIFALVFVLVMLLVSPQSVKKTTVTLNTIDNKVVPTVSVQTSSANTKSSISAGAPNIRVFHQMVNQLGGDLGCFGRVDGGVTNSGSADAQNVVVTCTAEEYSIEKDVGTVKAHDTKTFQAIINYDCSYQRYEECTVSCGNC